MTPVCLFTRYHLHSLTPPTYVIISNTGDDGNTAAAAAAAGAKRQKLEKEEEEEVDPLDAFMAGVQTKVCM